ncbi:hypothetical protein DFH07DRAFT_763520 [Mycena maculata]|uniref:CxC2-like cysteine cluster KDZ transposase-associated domain-containing protein n=1 Tax=Mycena maculata TaxID=230809 RepID=A0AAD7P2F2_9AGAR|nr:hypothetical protein DFH07DRAFT_763520 [Mycena maculata]
MHSDPVKDEVMDTLNVNEAPTTVQASESGVGDTDLVFYKRPTLVRDSVAMFKMLLSRAGSFYVTSYDIACQAKFIPTDKFTQIMRETNHCPVCQYTLLRDSPIIAHTDGEGVETAWALLNPEPMLKIEPPVTFRITCFAGKETIGGCKKHIGTCKSLREFGSKAEPTRKIHETPMSTPGRVTGKLKKKNDVKMEDGERWRNTDRPSARIEEKRYRNVLGDLFGTAVYDLRDAPKTEKCPSQLHRSLCGVAATFPNQWHIIALDAPAGVKILVSCSAFRTRKLLTRYTHCEGYTLAGTFGGLLPALDVQTRNLTSSAAQDLHQARLNREAAITTQMHAIETRIRELDDRLDRGQAGRTDTAGSPTTNSTSSTRGVARPQTSFNGAALYGRPSTVRRRPTPASRLGSRDLRETPLTHMDLWVDGVCPPDQVAIEPHHKCRLCEMVKSHPVTLWLEDDWKCPECSEPMRSAPFRQYAEEAGIAVAYPEWKKEDKSTVEYSWDGLHFPRTAKVVIVDRRRSQIYAASGFGEDDDDVERVGDIAVYFSSDGRHREEEMFNVSHKKRRVQPGELQDSFAEWIPVPDEDYQGMEDVHPTDNPMDGVASRKRKDYASSDDPMSLWRPLKGLFADELLRVLQEWNGNFWVELGHGGFACVYPDEKIHKMTIIEAPIIHEVRVRYCKCSKSDYADNLAQLLRNVWYPATVTDPGTCATFRTLKAYRLYAVVGNLNIHDFVRAMERATNATASTGMKWLPDRYKQLQRMARRSHDPGGVESTELGQTAVQCWTCPHDGRNLPENWRDVAPEFRFLYMLLIAVDTNFKLKNRMRANEVDDPPLGPGWSYWVEPVSTRTEGPSGHSD